MGSGGEGGGRGDWDGEYMYIHGWFMSIYNKNHYNIVISLQLIKKIEVKKRLIWPTYHSILLDLINMIWKKRKKLSPLNGSQK